MRASSFFRIVFILYCFEAGTLLLFAPWNVAWDQTMFNVTWEALRVILIHPLFRGAVSGFGIIHLVWGAHDLEVLLLRRRTAEPPAEIATAPPAGPADAPSDV
ncbi:MAG TPA: hypothetical protein VHU81_06495 [Thermoanaerobaculia bacterium]|jgi:hypothetical protein|nr:hypothetical protein [Thermoanaerobaculia bacterium]